VIATNPSAKKITFEIKPYSYSNTTYNFPSTATTYLYVRKFQAQVLFNNSNASILFNTPNGIRNFRVAIGNVGTLHNASFCSISNASAYVELLCSGFHTIWFENSDIEFLGIGLWASSCNSVTCNNTKMAPRNMSVGDCSQGLSCLSSSLQLAYYTYRISLHNNNWGLNLANTFFTTNVHNIQTTSASVCALYNTNEGIMVRNGSMLVGPNWHARYNGGTGMGVAFSKLELAPSSYQYYHSLFDNNGGNGFFCTHSSCHISYTTGRHNGNDGYAIYYSTVTADKKASGQTSYTTYTNNNGYNGWTIYQSSVKIRSTLTVYNTWYGIVIRYLSNANIEEVYCYNNGDTGVYIYYGSNAYILNSNIHDNGSYGIVNLGNSTCYMHYCNVDNNDNWGIYNRLNSKFRIDNPDSNDTIENNTNGNVYSKYNSQTIIYSAANITNTTPSINTTPSYSNQAGGSYILKS
jgi:hypothetical protein